VIVVDASAITAFFLREEGWNRLAQHVRRAVPVDHIVKEFYNAIWRALAIRKLISHEHAKKVLQLFKEYVEKSLVLDILDPNPYCTRDIEGSPFNSLYKALIKSRWG
jgi:predicted nucleic acid-binding protein